MARREVLTGKAKFGIVGDGKEVPQVAMARVFRAGDWRSGYYRDQTFMFAKELQSVEDFFAQLYADADNDPYSGGRQMNCHYATPTIDANGQWQSHLDQPNVSSDISPTAGQMARALGLALASKKYRENDALRTSTAFSDNGNEVVFATIGDASTSEGVFWETMNAAAVQQVPLVVSVWDDGYGISVPIEYQTVKSSISEALKGFQTQEESDTGIDIYTVRAWDYPALIELYETAVEKARRTHRPALIHVQEVTQQQGHSTSGSHERYKSPERLQWEKDHDCNAVMRKWLLDNEIATESQLQEIESEAKQTVKEGKKNAWKQYTQPIKTEYRMVLDLLGQYLDANDSSEVADLRAELEKAIDPLLADITAIVRRVLLLTIGQDHGSLDELRQWLQATQRKAKRRYETYLYSEDDNAALDVPPVAARYSDDSAEVNGYEVLNAYFDRQFEQRDYLYAFGEDVGQIGDVNQGFAGLQEKHGESRIFDTGIREWTIMGQALGMAMRGLRPIAEIQYLDYLLYGLVPLSDDLATVRYRSNNLQQAPAIIRTRGHRLEGIWHAGSPMGMIVHALRGMYVCVPRNMTQAAGMYNTLLQSNDPGLVVECLNGYRLKERRPDNLDTFTVPLGVPEVLREGSDVTVVSYGSTLRVIQEALPLLSKLGISIELIDVQTLLPFDLEHRIVESVRKTNRLLVVDEDVPGGATAYMLREILEVQNAYRYLDSAPMTLTAKAHRPPYGSDGDYFSKPQVEDVVEVLVEMLSEAEPSRFS